MRSYYDTLIDHLVQSNFGRISHGFKECLQNQIQKELSDASVRLNTKSINELAPPLNCEYANAAKEEYGKLIDLLEQRIELNLMEILGPYYQGWARFKCLQKKKEGSFHLEKSFQFWLKRQVGLSESLATYHRKWVKKHGVEFFLQVIEQYHRSKMTEPVFHYLPQEEWREIPVFELDFDSEENCKDAMESDTNPSGSLLLFPKQEAENINHKSMLSRIRLKVRMDGLYVLPLNLNARFSKVLLDDLFDQRGAFELFGRDQLSQIDLIRMKHLRIKNRLMAKKISLQLILEGDFSAEEYQLIEDSRPAFFPFYLSPRAEDQYKISRLKNVILIDFTRETKQADYFYHNHLQITGIL